MSTETAILAGGCFWGMEELFRHQRGVLDTDAGYTGGSLKNPTYQHLKSGTTGHAEALKIIFDPTQTSYEELLKFFFQIHDATTQDRQGNDRGSQYRSAIFYLDDSQKQTAETLIAAINASGKWPAKIITQLTPFEAFYKAEEDHQDYLQKYPTGYTCHWLRPKWTL